jgi:ATP-binding cassette subfamily F protein 3
MLRIDRLTYRIAGRTLLDGTAASINAGHRVGLVGRNGCGKTTLLRLIAGETEPSEGSISFPSRWRIGLTRQEAPGGPQTLIETVLAADRELTELIEDANTVEDGERIAEIHARLQDKDAHSAPARAARILAGLGFSEQDQQRPCAEYSGGWRMRVALAGLLFTAPDLLLLDEPTNHLDLEATLWLEDYLRGYPGTILLVSHDRDLLNRVVDEILHLDQGRLVLYQGGYDRFEQTRQMRVELNEKMRAKVEAERAHIRAFVDRFRYKASKAKQAQSRLKMLERLQPLPAQQDEGGVVLRFPEPEPLASPLLSLEKVTVGYDGRTVLGPLDLRLDADDRIALLGANGNGKSTLIKLLAGRLKPFAGHVSKSGKLRIGYFAQHQADELDVEASPLLQLSRRRPRDTDEQVRSHLGRFGFSQDRAETKIAALSGGEKARLLLALMSAERPHILLLDEPTNHLDVATREALVQAINDFEGAVIIVSHDPHVIQLTVDRFWLVADGRIETFDGDLDDYRAYLLDRARNDGSGRSRASAGDRQSPDRRDQRRQAAERRSLLAPLKKQLADAEAAVARLSEEQARLTRAMTDPGLYAGDAGRLIELRKRLGQVGKDLERAEDAWLGLQEAFDKAAADPS